jgi:periplasmic protein TonB
MTGPSFFTQALRWFVAPKQHCLRWGVAASLCVHAALLVWMPADKPRAAPITSNLEVLLVNSFTVQTALAPQVIAQQDLDGGGEVAARIASNPSPRIGEVADDISLAELTQQRQQLEALQTQLLKQLESTWGVMPDQLKGETTQDQPIAGPDETDQQAIEQNARLAALREQVEQYNSRPRKYFDAPSAVANPFAAYVDAWRTRIEATGAQHYPRSGETRLVGDLQASVTINAQGQVVDVTIDRPAKDGRLNQAVRRIVQLAEPFAPFPQQLATHTDELVITRTWVFTPGSLSTVSAPSTPNTQTP